MPETTFAEVVNADEAVLTHITPTVPADTGEITLGKRMLSLIQSGYPIAERPYEVLGKELGISEDEALACVRNLYDQGYIKRIGAVFDSAALGYVSTLAAMAVENPEDVERCAAIASAYPEVTHNYERSNRYNLWFTVIARDRVRLVRILDEIREKTGCADLLDLPADKLYKIRVDFRLDGKAAPDVSQWSSEYTPDRDSSKSDYFSAPDEGVAPLTEEDRAFVRALQDDLAVCPRPFDVVAAALSEEGVVTTAAEIVVRARSWADTGLIRRFGAVVKHRKLGFSANAMTVWDVPDAETDAAGAIMAADPRVSHCYRRPRYPSWPQNLYAMIHGRTEADCNACEADISAALEERGINASAPMHLYSTREFKKCSMRYFVEED